ncbi:izumo sperm-egg fusion protein 3 [Sceloporus undulatus]|uniref:izumo sperm-egg fusion protein 3 n=1 Tax=Sceloporus undulatus TaxID=8520 RepID=UPI001C4D058E|nr:izumo sperm-egg fusion protein 3 [Sceloporus undulatus]
MKETLPEDVPDRYTLIERHVQALADLHSTFLQKKYERVLDVRGVMSLKSDIISRLREINNSTWKGVFLWQLSMYKLRVFLQNHMQQTLEKFADFACSEDCTITEGPVLDCWTCLRIVVQCFDGELCGVEDKRLAEYNEIVLYVFLVCESVVLSSAVLIYLVCFKHKRMMIQKIIGH